MDIALRKLWRELWANRARTLIVLLSLSAGAAILGVVVNTYGRVSERLAWSHARSRPAHVEVLLSDGLADAALIERLRGLPGVAAVEGRVAGLDVEWRPTPEAAWQPAILVARADYARQSLNLIELLAGGWPDEASAAVDFNAVGHYGGVPGPGGVIYLRINNRPRPLAISGLVRDPEHAPAPAQSKPKFYVAPSTVAEITGQAGFLGLAIAVDDHDPARVEAALAAVEAHLQRAGLGIGLVQMKDPTRHFAQAQVDTIFAILVLAAAICLGLSAVLVANVMSVVMATQLPQIGIMKAIGGRHAQIAALYLGGAGLYGLLSLAVALPAGLLGSHALIRFVLWSLNVPAPALTIGLPALLLQCGACLLTPVLAAAWPVWRGARLRVREALAAYGLSGRGYGTQPWQRLAARLTGLPALPLLAARNALRDPARLGLIVLTLVAAGSAFITLLNGRAAFGGAIEASVRSQGFDVAVDLRGPQRSEEVAGLLQSLPGVQRLETWFAVGGVARRPQDGDSARGTLLVLKGVPEDGQLLQPQLVAGRGLTPGDERGLLLNAEAARELGVGLGDEIAFAAGRQAASTWVIVGLLADDVENTTPSGYVPLKALSEAQGQPGRTTQVMIRANTDLPGAQRVLAMEATARLEARGIQSQTTTAEDEIEALSAEYDAPLTLLMVIVGLVAGLSGVGLSGTLALNVIERRREIGLLRAIGAARREVALLFMGEGLALGLLSWAAAAGLSVATSEAFRYALGQSVTFALPRVYAGEGYLAWLGVVVGAGLLASWAPARAASRVSVRESLAYE